MKTYDENFNQEPPVEVDPYAEAPESGQQEAELQRRLDSFGALVQGWIKEAVDARDASGIEARWREDLKQYYGEDINVAQVRNLAESAADGPQTNTRSGERQTKSKVVVNITRPKTNAAIARLADMLLPTDDKNWGLQPTPDPSLAEDVSKTDIQLTHQGQPLETDGGEPATVAHAASAEMDAAKKACRAMEREIDDQLTECNYNGEQRKCLWDLGVLGTAILRGPFAKRRISRKWERAQDGSWQMTMIEDHVPAAIRVSPWRFFPDPACGGEIQNSRYAVEEDDFNAKTLRALRGQNGYITQNIDLCLSEGPKSARTGGRSQDRRYIDGEYRYDEKTMYEVYIVHGEFTKGDLFDAGVLELGQKQGDTVSIPEEERQDSVTGGVMVCNGRVIKAHLNPLQSDELPYSVSSYEKIDGQLFGVGVPFILRNPQRVVTAAWRIALDNAALSAGGQIVVNRKLVEPADGSWLVRGTKVWWAKDGTEDVNKAFATFQFDTRQQEMMQIIDKAMQFAEDESNLPAIMEGSTTDAPQTVGVATTLTNNSNTVLRRLVKEWDDNMTDTTITRFYDWNMTHSPKPEIKGDFQVDARGSSVLLVRDLQKQALASIGAYVVHPTLGVFHKRRGYDWLRTLYESNRITPDSVLIVDDEVDPLIKQMDEQAQQQPSDPRLQAAQIKAQSDQEITKAKLDDAERERQFDLAKWREQYQLELIKYANVNKVTLEEIQTRMTELLISQRHEERMQANEAALKMKFGTGL